MSNNRQQARLWKVLESRWQKRPTTSATPTTPAVQEEIMATRTADEWEEFLQARHVPAALSVSELGENLVVVLAKRGRRRVDALVRHGRT